MAVVNLAHDVKHDRMVAIKVLDTEDSIALGAERLQREIRMLARLRHPFILPLYDSGKAADARSALPPPVMNELPPLYRAFVHSTCGDRESTLTDLERGLEQRSDRMHSITTQPLFREYHAEPRFIQLVQNMRLSLPAGGE